MLFLALLPGVWVHRHCNHLSAPNFDAVIDGQADARFESLELLEAGAARDCFCHRLAALLRVKLIPVKIQSLQLFDKVSLAYRIRNLSQLCASETTILQ